MKSVRSLLLEITSYCVLAACDCCWPLELQYCRPCASRALTSVGILSPPPPAEWPRTLEINARLYSPCALATCWEFK